MIPLHHVNIQEFDLAEVVMRVSGMLKVSQFNLAIDKIDLDRDFLEIIEKEPDVVKFNAQPSMGSCPGSPVKRPKSIYQSEVVHTKVSVNPHFIDSMVAKHRDLKRKITVANKSMEEVEEEGSPSKSTEPNGPAETEMKDPRSISRTEQAPLSQDKRPPRSEDKKKSLVNLMCKTKNPATQALTPLFNK